jgi:hypothetical protein
MKIIDLLVGGLAYIGGQFMAGNNIFENILAK